MEGIEKNDFLAFPPSLSSSLKIGSRLKSLP